MKKTIVAGTVLFSMLTASYARQHSDHKISPFKPYITYQDHVAISVDHGDVLIYDKNDEDETVEITTDNKLYVHDKFVKTDPEQQALTRDYHDRVIQIKRGVNRIARDGAKIGLDGAKIGLKAVVGVFKLILPDYDSEDLDRDMEEESSKIEAKAEILEKRAAVIDSSVVDLEDLHYRLKDTIPALKRLEWF
jgi:hypothetical protein